VSLKPDLHEHTILIIDDNPANLGVLSSCLEEAGFETMVAIDGKSGLNIARDGQPDLILLDVLMPGMDGFEACRFMKEDERTREIPVIFMTALTETENEVAGFEAGGVDYITKPFQVEEVLARVKTHLALLLIQKRLKARNVQLLREIGKRQKVEKELRKARAELEERVEACTAELREANTRLTTEIDERKRAEKALFHEKEQFSVTLRSIEDGVVTTDKEGRVLFVNKAAESLTGWTLEEAAGRPFGEVFHIIDRRTRELCPNPVMIARDGTERVIADNGALILDQAGELFGAVLVFRDVTERKLAEEERIRLATALEQVAEGIIITDANWIVQYANAAFKRLSGYDRAEIVGRHTRILKSDYHDKAFYRSIRETLSRGEVWSGRLRNKRKDGTLYEVEATTSPVRNESGGIINYISIHRDMSREAALERQLRQVQKMEAIGTLAGGIAHDFNNILTAIIGYTEMALAMPPEAGSARRHLDQVLRSGSRAADLVKQILAFGRQTEQERKPVAVAPIVEEALKLLRSSLPSTIEIHQDVAVSEQEDIVMADPIQMHQVLMNLCTNAAHAMRDTGGILGVKLSEVHLDAFYFSLYPSLKPGSYVMLTVTDTGHGMDCATRQRIFDPYFTTKKAGEGTGLGLAVVHGIVKSHDGLITVFSEPGQGATFHVFLPRIEGERAEKAGPAAMLPTGDEHILFVDDEPPLAELGKEMLESLGYQVIAETSSIEALQTFSAQPDAFDLVITDMTMPGLTGRDLARKLMAIRTDLPVVLCTGFSEMIDERQSKEAGILEFVMKPYVTDSLARTIRKVLDRTID